MDVLLVEDEHLVREMLAEDLSDTGLEVTKAPSAEAALSAAGQADRPPAVLVTDINLGGGMDGIALAEEARRRWPGVGVVVMTGKPANLGGRRPDPREVCLLKPFGPPRLVAAVHGLMGRSCR
jgi:DNA-binding response OmpR family regulator